MKAAGIGLALAALAAGGWGVREAAAPPSGTGSATAVAPPVAASATEAGLSAVPEATPSGDAALPQEMPPYDGRFTFLRIRYGPDGGDLRGAGRFRRGGRGRQPPWEHDRPRAERNFAKILEATTTIDARQEDEAGIYLTLDDPDLFEYPIAYIVEVGYWTPTEVQVEALRNYLLKGGFLIVDDFRGRDLDNFLGQMQRVLPGFQPFELDGTDDIFNTFFRIDDPTSLVQYYDRQPEHYIGIFEDNDRSGRLMVIANYNNDIAEYWEWSDQGYVPIDLSNEAYKFGVNYIVYGMTH